MELVIKKYTFEISVADGSNGGTTTWKFKHDMVNRQQCRVPEIWNRKYQSLFSLAGVKQSVLKVRLIGLTESHKREEKS